MKILITGSSGYLGSVLARYFSERKIEVIGMDLHEHSAWKGNKHYRFIKSDVTDKGAVKDIFSKEKPTHVIHTAYLMDPLHDKKREYDIDVNGTKNVFEASNSTDSVKQFIEMSSSSIYGAWPDNKLWIKETSQLRPKDFNYAIYKKEIELYLNSFKKRRDMRLVILRMCTLIGPFYHKKGGVVAAFVNSPFFLKVNGRYCEVQFIYEDDVTALFDRIVHDKTIEDTYNLASDSYATTKDFNPNKLFIYAPLWLLRWIVRILWWLRLIGLTPAMMDTITYGIVSDPGKLLKRYHYKCRYTTSEAFRRTVEERKRNGTL